MTSERKEAKLIESKLTEAVEAAKRLGVKKKELERMLSLLLEED
ncbi:MAG: hypothetical protein NTZ35_18385 [Ignavibacteriales bacterium]|nr:hypothetical protein [Ignavibacteriales bacterium]